MIFFCCKFCCMIHADINFYFKEMKIKFNLHITHMQLMFDVDLRWMDVLIICNLT